MASTTRQLAERYRAELNAVTTELQQKLREAERKGNPKAGVRARRAYWIAYRKLHKRVMPRGNNFVLRFEGMI